MKTSRNNAVHKVLISTLAIIAGLTVQTPMIFAKSAMNATTKSGLDKFALVLPDGLWVSQDGKRSRITDGWIVKAEWSPDGQWLAFLKAVKTHDKPEVWVYNMNTRRRKQLVHGDDISFTPDKNVLAIHSHSTLNLYDLRWGASDNRQIQMLGINSYTFSPRGDVLLLGSHGHLRPDGWTNAILYKSHLRSDISPTSPVRFFIVPNQIPLANLPGVIHSAGRALTIPAVHVTNLKYNRTGNWLGFVVSPTAGLSVDHNALCILRDNGQAWRTIGNIAGYYSGGWGFAPNGRLIGFVAGDERWPYRHKKVVTTTLEDGRSNVWTPAGAADDALTWASNTSLVVSRGKEQPVPHGQYVTPPASLYRIDTDNGRQLRLTAPPTGYGDYRPQTQSGWLIWTRASQERGDVWIANTNGTNARILVRNVGGTRMRPAIVVFPPR